MVDTVGSGMPFVATGNGGDSGFGGGSAIWAIVLIALLGFNRGGRGDDCGGGTREAIDNAEVNARFNGLENRIDNLGDRQDLARNLEETCKVNMNVAETANVTQREILEAKFDNAIIAKDAQLSAQECCCTTQRAIDGVGFNLQSQIAECCCTTNLNNERNTNALMGAIRAEGEATRAQLTADKIESLRDKVTELQLKESQTLQNQYLIDRLGPQTPVPAYVTYPNCSPVFPPAVAASSQAVYGAFGLNGGNGCACGGF